MLVLSMHAAEQFEKRMINAGASGLLTKDSPPIELVNAITEVISGKRYLSPTVTDELARQGDADVNQRPHETLSDREYQVLRMIASGLTVSQVALRLSLSVKTVSTSPGTPAREDGDENHRRADALRHPAQCRRLEPHLDGQLYLARGRRLRILAERGQPRGRKNAGAENVVHGGVVGAIEEVEDLEDTIHRERPDRKSTREPHVDRRLTGQRPAVASNRRSDVPGDPTGAVGRAAIAITVQVGSGQDVVRAAGGHGDDRGERDLVREQVHSLRTKR